MTGLDAEPDNGPESPVLLQNYPNPFNPETTVTYHLPAAGRARLTLYNIRGQKVKTVLDRYHRAGSHDVPFAAYDLPAGIYVIQLKTADQIRSKKIVLLP